MSTWTRRGSSRASLPTRGAWIEIRRRGRRSRWRSRSPRGERGLKFLALAHELLARRRSPRGERGLKFWELDLVDVSAAVAPHAGSVD